jgi:hypothetical protein
MSAPTLGGGWQADLLALEPGWDSYGARPITNKAISTLASFSVVPICTGGIQLEVHRDGIGIEIEIGPEGRILFVSVYPEATA